MEKYSNQTAVLGAIEIAPEVIESIAGIVASKVEGFHPLSGIIGVSIPKLALLLQNKIKEQLLFSCELEISQVNIHVQTIIPAKNVDSELFELGDEE